jgi:group I intron endonuclease
LKVIYVIENIKNGKVYIGKSIRYTNRKKEHIKELDNNSHWNRHLQSAYNLYGIDAFDFYILYITDSEKDLNESEIFFINWYKSLDLNYNIDIGGKGPTERSDETRRLISEKGKGRIQSEESKRKRSISMKESWKNKTEEEKKERSKKISESKMGHEVSEEQREKQRSSMTGKPGPNRGRNWSEETKQKISDGLKGNIPWNKGKKTGKPAWNTGLSTGPLSEEHKKKLSESNKGKHDYLGVKKGTKFSDERKNNMRKAFKGRVISEEQKKKISNANKGRIPWNKGLKMKDYKKERES